MDYSEGWEAGTPACYLDDCRTPRPNHWFSWEIVRSYKEFVNYILQRGVPRFMSLDHDMSTSLPEYATELEEAEAALLPMVQTDQGRFRQDVIMEPSGLDAAKWLVEYCLDNDVLMPHFTCHSANPTGAANILALLNNLQKAQGQEPNGYRTCW